MDHTSHQRFCFAFFCFIIISMASMDAQAKFYPGSLEKSHAQTTIAGKVSYPTWFYDGLACEKSPQGLSLTVGHNTCKYSETDRDHNQMDCKGTQLVCVGPKCPGRSCGSARRRSKAQEEHAAIRSERVGFRQIEPRMVKQPGSIPPLRVG